ncbi:MAG: glycosyltransferase family 39 protein [Solobacterium sp.]|nr:glycosyltransferase family 39 protein [Solobacterium sp.]
MGSVLRSLPLVYIMLATGTLLYLFSSWPGRLAGRVSKVLCGDRPLRNALLWAGIALVLALPLLVDNHTWGDDFAQYIRQAQVIAEGTSEEWLARSNFIYSHSRFGLGTVTYPWGTPLLLLPVYKLFGFNIAAFKGAEMICLVLSVFVLALIMQRRFPAPAAFVCTMFCGMNQVYLQCINDVQSNLPCLLFSVLTVDAADRYLRDRSVLKAVLFGLAASAAVLQRTLALALFVGMFLYDAADLAAKRAEINKKDLFVRALPYAVFVIIYLAVKILLPSQGGYGGYFKLDIQMILTHLHDYFNVFRLFFTDYWYGYFERRVILHLLTLAFLLLSFYGMYLRRKEDVFPAFYAVVLMGVLMVFDGFQGVLYLLPVFPFFVLYACAALRHISAHMPEVMGRALRGFLISMLGVMLVYDLYLIPNMRSADKRENYAFSPDAMEMYKAVDETVPAGAEIYFFKPRLLELMCDVKPFWCDSGEDLWKQGDYILVSVFDEDGARIRSMAADEKYPVLFENDRCVLYEVRK